MQRLATKTSFFYFIGGISEESECILPPDAATLTAAAGETIPNEEFLSIKKQRERNSWYSTEASNLFVYDNNNETPKEAVTRLRDLLKKGANNCKDLLGLIDGWFGDDNGHGGFEENDFSSGEIEAMLAKYKDVATILSCALTTVLQLNGFEGVVSNQWESSITKALKKANDLGLSRYTPNRSERTLMLHFRQFRECGLFPNIVELCARGGPSLLCAYPALAAQMRLWSNQNLKVLKPKTFKDHLLNEALPNLLKTLTNNKLPNDLTTALLLL